MGKVTETSTGASITDELLEMQVQNLRKGHKPCTIVQYLDQLSDEEREGVKQAMANPVINGSTIASWFERRGMPLKGASVQRHRNYRCSCEKDANV